MDLAYENVQIRISKKQPATQIGISTALLAQWELVQETDVTVQLGHTLRKVKVMPIKHLGEIDGSGKATVQDRILVLSHKLFHSCPIPSGITFHALFRNGIIRLGPVIGILADGATPMVSKLMRTAAKDRQLLIYRFSPKDVNWQEKLVYGHYRLSKKKENWKSGPSPIPDVIINHIRSRKTHHSAAFQNFLKNLRQFTHSKLFNTHFFNKKDVHIYLSSDDDLHPYIPWTLTEPTLQSVNDMIMYNTAVFFKPIDGFFGYGIYKVSFDWPNKRYVCEASFKGSKIHRTYQSLQTLIDRHIDLSKYIVQQEIVLPRYGKDFFDLRVHVNKNGNNEWVVTAIGANVNKVKNITTHGGWIKPGQLLLKQLFHERAEFIITEIHLVAAKIGQALETGYDCAFGDLGIDMCVDKNGRLWIFEVNSFPGRHIFKHRQLEPMYAKSDQLLLDYCQYVFRQSAKNSEYRQRRTVIPYRLAPIKNSREARMPSYAPRVAGFA